MKYKNKGMVCSVNRSLLNAFREIDLIFALICQTILEIELTCYSNKLMTIQIFGFAIASASLHIACKQEGLLRIFKNICVVSKVSKKEIGRVFNYY